MLNHDFEGPLAKYYGIHTYLRKKRYLSSFAMEKYAILALLPWKNTLFWEIQYTIEKYAIWAILP